ncbi:hypothetical protein FKM82_019150 [Ascaphus truei]
MGDRAVLMCACVGVGVRVSVYVCRCTCVGVRVSVYVCRCTCVGILQADGGNYCACVNAATLAVIDAGIPMRDYVCACSAGFIEDTPLADLSYVEEASGGPQLALALLPKSDQIALLEMNARLHEDHLEKVMDAASKACKDVYAVLDQAVREHLQEVTALVGD